MNRFYRVLEMGKYEALLVENKAAISAAAKLGNRERVRELEFEAKSLRMFYQMAYYA